MSARMRWLLLLTLAGCPANPPASPRTGAPPAIRARIDQGTSTWVDVTVTGPSDQARVLCERAWSLGPVTVTSTHVLVP